MLQPDFILDLYPSFTRIYCRDESPTSVISFLYFRIESKHPFMGLRNPTWNPPHAQRCLVRDPIHVELLHSSRFMGIWKTYFTTSGQECERIFLK